MCCIDRLNPQVKADIQGAQNCLKLTAAFGHKRPLADIDKHKTQGDNAGSVGKARRSIDRQPNQDTAAPSRNPTRIVSAVGMRA